MNRVNTLTFNKLTVNTLTNNILMVNTVAFNTLAVKTFSHDTEVPRKMKTLNPYTVWFPFFKN